MLRAAWHTGHVHVTPAHCLDSESAVLPGGSEDPSDAFESHQFLKTLGCCPTYFPGMVPVYAGGYVLPPFNR